MTTSSLTVCCTLLAIDPKTLRRWVALAHLVPQPDPLDARQRCLTLPQLTLLARLHAHPLLSLPSAPPPPAPESPGVPDLDLRAAMTVLETRVTLLQEQVAQLTSALIRERDLRLQQLVGVTQPLRPPADASPLSPLSPVASAPSPQAPAQPPSSPLQPLPRHPHPPVIPLIEARADGTVTLICPQRGILPLVPDSAEWFEWLASLPSFRFQGSQGSFGVQRKTIGGLPTREWRAYKHYHNRQHGFYLGMTEALTVAHLEYMAATITARLATL